MAEKWMQEVTESPDFDKGGLHRELGVKEGKTIPCGKLRRAWRKAKRQDDKDMLDKLKFAFNTGSKKCKPAGYGKDKK